MKSKFVVIFLWSLILIAVQMGLLFSPGLEYSTAADEPDLVLGQILDRMEAQYTGKSFKAEFAQETTLKAMDITDFATGKMFVRYPGMMRWEYDKPEKHTIYSYVPRCDDILGHNHFFIWNGLFTKSIF